MGFVQIAMNNARLRLFLGNFVFSKAKMSSKSSTPSHYETLEVNHRATQGEIKSAYFKLTKQYHPDKNCSAEATAKFRDVAEAYEVLGNYTSRKIYDRSMLTKTQYHSAQQTEKSVDPKIKYYQSQAAVFRDGQKSGSVPLYDFDTWTKAHYGRTFNRTMRAKAESTKIRTDREIFYRESDTAKEAALIWLTMLFVTVMLIFSIRLPGDSDHVLPVHQRGATLENGSTEMNSQRSDA